MKKIAIVSTIAAFAVMGHAADANLAAELATLKAQVAELKKNQESMNVAGLAEQMKELKTKTGGDNIKWSADYRASYDQVSYTTVGDGAGKSSAGVLSNRLWLGAKAAPRNDLSFVAQIAYNKTFGDTANHSQSAVSSSSAGYYNTFDWFTNEKAADNTLKLKNAYVIYFGNAGNVPYTASVGRRSSTNGLLANLRDDDAVASPNAHMINVEFDGASFKFDLDKVTGVPGMSFKLCMGRGLSNSREYLTNSGTYGTNDKSKNTNIDMFGFIATPYDDGQYAVNIQAFKAWNLIGFGKIDTYSMMGMPANMGGMWPGFTPTTQDTWAFKNLGNMYGLTTSLIATGIGSGISDFLDNTTAFVSYSVSKTDPNGNDMGGMLGSTDPKVGNSFYAGVQMPAVFTKDGKIGLEYNQGSKYWRSFTYGEDTMVGSKLAARGRAYEAYYTQPLLGDILSMQLRATYIQYDYTGSNGFFGTEGTPMSMNEVIQYSQLGTNTGAVKEATNLRGYLRYRF